MRVLTDLVSSECSHPACRWPPSHHVPSQPFPGAPDMWTGSREGEREERDPLVPFLIRTLTLEVLELQAENKEGAKSNLNPSGGDFPGQF